MSRIGNRPIPVPGGVTITIEDRRVTVAGPKGQLEYEHRPEVQVEFDEEKRELRVARFDDTRPSKAFHGLTRSLLENMVVGVTEGYEKRLEIVGVGYLASISGDTLQVRCGFANEVHKKIPGGLNVTCPDQTHIVVQGCDKQQVGQFASEVRAIRKPEPYKGKGIRFQGEQIKIKPGKAAT